MNDNKCFYIRDIDNSPVATVVWRVVDSERVEYALACCHSKKDRFVKERGRTIATARLEAGKAHGQVIDSTPFRAIMTNIVGRYRVNDPNVPKHVGELAREFLMNA